MDKITILLKQANQVRNTIFLQREASAVGTVLTEVNNSIQLEDQSAEFQAAFQAFVNAAKAVFTQQVGELEENWVVDTAISNDKQDATIIRRAYANFPNKTLTSYELPVVIRHYRGGVHIVGERPDFVKTFYAIKGRTIQVEGQPVDEYGHFESIGRLVPMPQVLEGIIAQEDAAGSFDLAIQA